MYWHSMVEKYNDYYLLRNAKKEVCIFEELLKSHLLFLCHPFLVKRQKYQKHNN